MLDNDVINQYDGLIFDMDGTVIDAMPLDKLEDVIELKREYGKKLIMQHATLLPAANIVRAFYNKKPLALGTGSHRPIAKILLDKFDFEKYFSAIVTAEDIQNHKPAPDTFLRCAELIQAKPQRCLVFEDGDFGIQAGLRAGMDVFDVRVNKLIRGNS
ncbi:HAD-IA family hydrolase [Aggregatibacter segnis]|uniref:HAD-IA family hydrolase n=1 Tax=Aggregatibacter segnis TaxID=739 RepID=UPI0028EC1281|nr:HAD-IA family hydrolase [Aggregatibacter segnis]